MNAAFQNQQVTVMGLGSFGGGVGVARWLSAQGARVTVTDLSDAARLSDSIRQLDGLNIRFALGGHQAEDFRHADLVVVNPAVPDGSEYLELAQTAGVPITTEINLFVERCRARCVGVTGSVGKSTTVAMTEHVLRNGGFAAADCSAADAAPRVWLGGNIGASLLDALPRIAEADVVVLELSSFQLHRTPAVRWSPHIAAFTNISPNHLDWHGSFENYVGDKLNLCAFQNAAGEVVTGVDATLQRALAERRRHPRGLWVSTADGDGISALRFRHPTATPSETLEHRRVALGVPGRHNLQNASITLTVAHLLGVPAERASAALRSFAGLPHRLQRVTTSGGVTFYNDSKSTTPDATITALNSFPADTPLLVILGGYDKHVDLTQAAEFAARRARFAACIGQTGPTIAAAVRQAGGEASVLDSFEAAVAECRRRARPGDVVLLSPACASWGMFTDYRQRGEVFTRLVSQENA